MSIQVHTYSKQNKKIQSEMATTILSKQIQSNQKQYLWYIIIYFMSCTENKEQVLLEEQTLDTFKMSTRLIQEFVEEYTKKNKEARVKHF